MSRYKRKKHSFQSDIRRYGFWSTVKYRFKHMYIPYWFWYALIGIIVIPILIYFLNITGLPYDALSFVFYISELAFISYIMYRFMMRLERIRIKSDLSLFGLRLLSMIIGGIGVYLSLIFLMFGMPMLTMMEATGDVSPMLQIYRFMGFELRR